MHHMNASNPLAVVCNTLQTKLERQLQFRYATAEATMKKKTF